MDSGLVMARLIHFATAMAAFGGVAFRLYALDQDTDGAPAGFVASFDRWNIQLLRLSAALMILSALAIIPFVSARMAGTASAAFDPATIATVLSATEFGRVWCWHLLFAVLLIASSAFAPHRLLLNLIWAALALASLGWVGHAADGRGWAGFGREVNQSIHLLAGGMWIGGLLPLGWLLARTRVDRDGSGILVRRALPAFSQMGYAAVAVIAITGAMNTLTLAGSPDALLGTAYGRLLSLKILLYLAMVAIALRNRFRLVPRLASVNGATGRALYRSVLIEQAIGFGILAVVSLLGTWPPPMMHHH